MGRKEEREKEKERKKGRKSRPGTARMKTPRSKEKPSLKGRKGKREKTGRKHCRNRVATCASDETINKLDLLASTRLKKEQMP